MIQTGQATWDEGLLLFLERRGFLEETYHTFSYSPVPDDRGGVGGMLCVVTEDTERTIGERRLRTLRNWRRRPPMQADRSRMRATRPRKILAGNNRDVPFALLYLLDAEGTRATLIRTTGVERHTPISPAAILVNDLGSPWPIERSLRPAGRFSSATCRRSSAHCRVALAGAGTAGHRTADGEAGPNATRRVHRGWPFLAASEGHSAAAERACLMTSLRTVSRPRGRPPGPGKTGSPGFSGSLGEPGAAGRQRCGR